MNKKHTHTYVRASEVNTHTTVSLSLSLSLSILNFMCIASMVATCTLNSSSSEVEAGRSVVHGEFQASQSYIERLSIFQVLSSIPSNHMVAHSHLEWDPMPSSHVSEDSYGVLTYIK